jgi:hypothetical protein
LEQVILRALAIKPEDRYNTATDFRLVFGAKRLVLKAAVGRIKGLAEILP